MIKTIGFQLFSSIVEEIMYLLKEDNSCKLNLAHRFSSIKTVENTFVFLKDNSFITFYIFYKTSHLHMIKKLRIFLIIIRRRYFFLFKRLQYILIIHSQSFIRLVKLFLTFKINLIKFVMILCLYNFISKFEHKCLKSLPFDFCKSIVYWCKLLFVFWFLYLTKIAFKMTLIFLLRW